VVVSARRAPERPERADLGWPRGGRRTLKPSNRRSPVARAGRLPSLGLETAAPTADLEAVVSRVDEMRYRRASTVGESERDPRRIVAAFAEQKLCLDVSTLELCFLAYLRLQSKSESLPALGEEQLQDAFEQVCEAVEPETENVRARATHAIRRLREQRLLSRVDGAGVLRAGEFSLSPLAVAIIDHYVNGETLTRESLNLLTRTLAMSLSQIVAAARKATAPEHWRDEVAAPL